MSVMSVSSVRMSVTCSRRAGDLRGEAVNSDMRILLIYIDSNPANVIGRILRGPDMYLLGRIELLRMKAHEKKIECTL